MEKNKKHKIGGDMENHIGAEDFSITETKIGKNSVEPEPVMQDEANDKLRSELE